jgi:hypothetical protein
MTIARLQRRFRFSDWAQYRWLEIIPGAAVWLTLLAAIGTSFIAPTVAIGFIIIFDLYWLIRVLYILVYLILAYRRFRQASQVHWSAKLHEVPGWSTITHVIMLPTFREPYAVLRDTMLSLSKVEYPLDRFIVVLATEERDAENIRPIATKLKDEFSNTFGGFLVTEHPGNIVGEVAGKGSNIAWAGREVKKLIDERGLPYDQILVSTFDADTVAHRQYFSYLTLTFLQHPNRLRTSYQPIPLFHNNIWDARAMMRVVANSTTVWLLTETMRPDRLFTFSSHSMPWQALIDVDFWQADIVTEDSRIFLQCYIRYDGDYQVTPMYIPISMDTVHSESLRRTLQNQYYQIRRWAYGVENFPYMVWNFSKNPLIPRSQKIKYIWNQLEGVYTWATAPILIWLIGWLPFHTGHPSLSTSVLAANAPAIIGWLMTGAMTGLITTAIITSVLLPTKPTHRPWWYWPVMLAQWALLPVTMVIFGSVPAIDAQTKLMMGRYLGFWVTEKSRPT